MRCANCGNSAGFPISITANVHEGCCASCFENWTGRAEKEEVAAMQRPGHVLAVYRRWQAWRRATLKPMPAPQAAHA